MKKIALAACLIFAFGIPTKAQLLTLSCDPSNCRDDLLGVYTGETSVDNDSVCVQLFGLGDVWSCAFAENCSVAHNLSSRGGWILYGSSEDLRYSTSTVRVQSTGSTVWYGEVSKNM